MGQTATTLIAFLAFVLGVITTSVIYLRHGPASACEHCPHCWDRDQGTPGGYVGRHHA